MDPTVLVIYEILRVNQSLLGIQHLPSFEPDNALLRYLSQKR